MTRWQFIPYYWFYCKWPLGLSPVWLFWGWQESSTSLHASSAGLNCPLQVSPWTFVLECIKIHYYIIKTNFFPFPSYRRALCSVCFASFINLLLFFPPDLPLAFLLPDYPTAGVWSAPCFQYSFWPNYSCLEFFLIWALLLQPKFAAQHIQASKGEQFQWAKAGSLPTCSSAPWTLEQ